MVSFQGMFHAISFHGTHSRFFLNLAGPPPLLSPPFPVSPFCQGPWGLVGTLPVCTRRWSGPFLPRFDTLHRSQWQTSGRNDRSVGTREEQRMLSHRALLGRSAAEKESTICEGWRMHGELGGIDNGDDQEGDVCQVRLVTIFSGGVGVRLPGPPSRVSQEEWSVRGGWGEDGSLGSGHQGGGVCQHLSPAFGKRQGQGELHI